MTTESAHIVQRRQRRQNRDNNALRHRIHACAYATVAFGLFTMGCVFSGFAIFKTKSEISKIWLAGPTTIAVALVLCGKVMIDRRPRQFPMECVDDDDCVEGVVVEGAQIDWRQAAIKELEAASFNDPGTFLHLAQKKGADLVIENFYVTDPRLSKPVKQQMSSDLESQIWNLRAPDLPSVSEKIERRPNLQNFLQNNFRVHHQNSNFKKSISNAKIDSGENSYPKIANNDIEKKMEKKRRRSGGSIPQLWIDNCKNPLLIDLMKTNKKQSGTCQIYQGETFLINDKPYLI